MNDDIMPDDFFDDYLDDCIEEIEDEEENDTFENRLKEYGKGISSLRREYREFIDFYRNTSKRLGLTDDRKYFVCRSLCDEIEKSGSDPDLDRMWCVCLSENSDFLFENEGDERYRLHNYLLLKKDIEKWMTQLNKEKEYSEKARKLIEGISFGSTPAAEFDLEDFFSRISIAANIEGEYFEDNLRNVTDKALCSDELTELLPLMYYVLFTRYRNKLLDSLGYDPNFQKLFRYVEYRIDEDNGKNITAFNEHVDYYEAMCSYFDNCDKYLNDCAFSVISNISRCSFVDWDEFPCHTRPLYNTLQDSFFSCNIDNQYQKENIASISDIIRIEYEDENRPLKLQFIPRFKQYIETNEQIKSEYIRLMREGKTDRCLPLIMKIISGSAIDADLIDPRDTNALNAVIVNELIRCIDSDMKEELIGLNRHRMI